MQWEGVALTLEAAPVPMLLVDATGRIRLANPAACDLIGAERETVLAHRVEDLVPEAQRGAHAGDRARYLRDPTRRNMGENRDLSLQRLDGQTVPVEIGLNPVRVDGQALVLCSILDLTERRRTVQERLQLEKQAAEADRLRSLEVLAGGVAHDFNNMLVAVLGNASLLASALEHDKELVEWVSDIETAATQAAELAKQMLAFSGGGRFVVEPTDMSALLRSFLPLLRTLTPSQVALRTWLDDEMPLIRVDKNQLRQVVTNLIGNAVDAARASGGTIGLRTRTDKLTEEMLAQGNWHGATFTGPAVCIEVSDDGVGMPEDVLERIFEPFFTTRAKGHGMGLAALLGIVRGHAGCLRVYSVPGQGTTFKILLPITEATEVTEDLEAAELPPRPRRVLVIDDEISVLRIVERVLRRADFSVVTESAPAAGIDAFRALHEDLDLVLLDLSMPELDGTEVFRALESIDPKVPVVVMSGFSEKEIETRFIGRRVTSLSKPFSAKVLVEVVEGAAR